jgi:exodeoxyribonuclease VII large subunit
MRATASEAAWHTVASQLWTPFLPGGLSGVPWVLQKPWQHPLRTDMNAVAPGPSVSPPIWGVGPLMRAVADALAVRFNPIQVRGEISGFSRAASGHCYFSLKDADGQVRCAMFRRSATALGFAPRDGDRVEVQGRLDVYGPRGDLQLIVDGMRQAGQGGLFEQFMQLKARLEAQGLFDPSRKRALPAMPESLGVVTSLGAAALRDVATALARRVPHIPVTVFPAAVQGAQAPAELCAALQAAYQCHATTGHPQVLLVVRGGGSMEDLWAFNNEALAHTLAAAPMPVVCGVGHETDFTIADFVADLRAPTPTAAAELCATDQGTAWGVLAWYAQRLHDTTCNRLDTQAQRLDRWAQRLARPSDRVGQQRQRLAGLDFQMRQGMLKIMQHKIQYCKAVEANFVQKTSHRLEREHQRLARGEAALSALNPRLVLQRGYAWLSDTEGHAVTQASATHPGQSLRASLADGEVDLRVV